MSKIPIDDWKCKCSCGHYETDFTLTKRQAVNYAYSHTRQPGTHQVDVFQLDKSIDIIISKFAAKKSHLDTCKDCNNPMDNCRCNEEERCSME